MCGCIPEGTFSHLYIITLYLNARYFSDPLLETLRDLEEAKSDRLTEKHTFLDLLGLTLKLCHVPCRLGRGNRTHRLGRKGAQTWDPQHAGTLCFTDLFPQVVFVSDLTRGQVPLHLASFPKAWAAPAQWAGEEAECRLMTPLCT